MVELSNSQKSLEYAEAMQEFDNGKPFTYPSLKAFLEEHKLIATTCSEKMAGCQARVKSRGN